MKNFYKILSGKASIEEKKDFYEMLENSPKARRKFLLEKNIYSLLGANQFSTSGKFKEDSFEQFWNKRGNRKEGKIYLNKFLKYAAVLLLMFASGLGTYLSFNTSGDSNVLVYESQKASISSIVLSDGSKIWLNSNSKIEIEESKKIVHAKLVGEAYFDIIHNDKREFLINMGSFMIRDLGTEFNIRAYPEDDNFATTLIEGDVEILDGNENLIYNMNPGENAVFNRISGSFKVEKTDVSIYSSWKENKFVFIDKNLLQICQELEKWYGIHVTIENPAHASSNYTCILERSIAVKQVMDMLKIVSDINYRIEKDQHGEEIIVIE